MQRNAHLIGVDLGGTKLGVGRVAGDKVLEYRSVLLQKEQLEHDDRAIVDAIVDTVSSVFDNRIKGIGVGVPSVVDRKNGIVYEVVNIPSWKEVHLKTILETRFKVPAFIDNDANCFALGEKLYGKGRKYDNFVALTIGTGIGGGNNKQREAA